ncbi:hypothetical protein LINGRAHAP2_LOCUS4663 [Linum grandiflorum]
MMLWGDALRKKRSREGYVIWDLPRHPLSQGVWFEYKHSWSAPRQFKFRTRCSDNLRRLCSKSWRGKLVVSTPSCKRWVKCCKVLWRVHPNLYMTRLDLGHLKLVIENAQHQIVR